MASSVPPIPNAETLEDNCGALQVFEGLPVKASSQTDVEAGQLVYIARDDGTATSRTLAIKFTAVPPNLGDASPFSDARMFVESNATTGDVGIRAFVDGEPWNSVRIIGPDQRIFRAFGVGSLGELGLTELSFATHEPAREGRRSTSSWRCSRRASTNSGARPSRATGSSGRRP